MAEIDVELKFIIIRADTYAYYQTDGEWGEATTAQSFSHESDENLRDELEEALGVQCEVVMA